MSPEDSPADSTNSETNSDGQSLQDQQGKMVNDAVEAADATPQLHDWTNDAVTLAIGVGIPIAVAISVLYFVLTGQITADVEFNASFSNVATGPIGFAIAGFILFMGAKLYGPGVVTNVIDAIKE